MDQALAVADQPPVITPPPKPVKRLAAWVCLLLNLFVLPGLGSLIVREPVKGIIQGILAVSGFALSIAGSGPLLDQFIQTHELPDHLTGSLWLAIAGVVLFAIAWVWALTGSVSAIKKTGKKRP